MLNIPKSKNQKLKRLIELDSLRGIACISVILFHYTSYYELNWKHSQKPLVLFEYGKYGVELFFLLSGFVIFMSLKNKSVQEFAILRFCRLFPTYWIAIVFIFMISRVVILSPEIVVHGDISFPELLVNFTMIPTIFSFRYVDSSHWSLGFELLFYLQIAVIFVITNKRENLILSALLLVTSISIFWHSFIRYFNIEPWMTVWWNEDMSHWQYIIAKLFVLPYIHLFLIGVSSYLLYQKQTLRLARIGIIFGVISDYFIWGWEHLVAVVFVTLLFYTAIFFKLPFLRSQLLAYLGTISYSLYLIHQNIGFRIIQVTEKLGVNSNVAIIIAIFSAIVLAHPLYFFIEKPSYEFIKFRLAVRKDARSRLN
jgi:peptidoglycan/LPS O-acetylase OafA/YrhL